MLTSNPRGDDVNPFAALHDQPPVLLWAQLLLLGLFIASYVAAVTGLLDARGRLRAAGAALLAGVGLGFAFTPWTLGAMLAAASVAGIGVFIGTSWLLSRLLGVHEPAYAPQTVAAPAREEPRPLPRGARRGFSQPTAPAPLH